MSAKNPIPAASQDSPRVQQAHFKARSSRARNEELDKLAIQFAPAFVFKYDFSKPEDYDGLMDYSYKAASAALKRRSELAATVTAVLQAELEEAHRLDAAEKTVVQPEEDAT